MMESSESEEISSGSEYNPSDSFSESEISDDEDAPEKISDLNGLSDHSDSSISVHQEIDEISQGYVSGFDPLSDDEVISTVGDHFLKRKATQEARAHDQTGQESHNSKVCQEVKIRKINEHVIKKIFLDSSTESVDLNINLKGVGAVIKNKNNEVLLTSKDGLKKNVCYYCYVKRLKSNDPLIKVHFVNLVDHYESAHCKEKLVIKLMQIKKVPIVKGQPRPQKLKERLEILDYLRNKANFINNLFANDVTEFVVSRRPTKVGNTASNYGTCFKCYKQLSLSSIRKHVSVCAGLSFKKKRVVKVYSRATMTDYHEIASAEAIKIIAHMREDNILNEIRYDRTVFIWLNAEASKYEKAPHNHNKIRASLRRLGRLVQLMKALNDDVNELADIFHENRYDDFITAIKNMGKLDSVTKEMQAPATASDMFHLIRSVTSVYDVMLGEKNSGQRLLVQAFEKKMIRLWHSSIGNTIAEQQAENKRNKKFEMPAQSDLSGLKEYLNKEIILAYQNLKREYTNSNYEKLRDTLGCYLQISNCRRVGEVQRFRMSEFKAIQVKGDNCRVAVRGKRSKPVPIIFNKKLYSCLILLVQNRSMAMIAKDNPYVFAKIHDINEEFSYIDLGNAMAIFADLSGAENPATLRGTAFRKQVATDRLEKGINNEGVEDLSSFFGHTPHIHRQNYQQSLFERDVRVSKLVGESQTGKNTTMQENETSVNYDYFMEDNCNNLTINEDTCSVNSDIPNGRGRKKTQKTTGIKNTNVTIKAGKKISWKDKQINILLARFPDCLKLNCKVPSAAEIKKFINATDDQVLKNRSEPQIRSWIHPQRKEQKTKSDLPQRNNIPNYIYAAFQPYIDAGKEPPPKACGKFLAKSPSRSNITIQNIQEWVKLAIKRKSI